MEISEYHNLTKIPCAFILNRNGTKARGLLSRRRQSSTYDNSPCSTIKDIFPTGSYPRKVGTSFCPWPRLCGCRIDGSRDRGAACPRSGMRVLVFLRKVGRKLRLRPRWWPWSWPNRNRIQSQDQSLNRSRNRNQSRSQNRNQMPERKRSGAWGSLRGRQAAICSGGTH